MELNSIPLPPEIEASVLANHGGPVTLAGEHGQYVVMRSDVFGGALSPNPAELADSVSASKRSLAQAAAGETRLASEVFDELESRYGS